MAKLHKSKKVRQQKILDIIKETGGISHEKLRAIAAFDVGISEKTLNSYLRDASVLGFIVWDSEVKQWKLKNA